MTTKAIKSFCKDITFLTEIETKCGNFSALPTVNCFPILYDDFKKVYEDKYRDEVLNKINSSDAYFLHCWNKMQDFGKKEYKLKFDSGSAYIHLAKTHCPNVYRTLEKHF